MNKMVVTIALVVVGLLLIGAVFYAQRKSGNGKEEISSEEVSKPRVDISDDKFNYEVSCSAPRLSPAEYLYVDFVGESGALSAFGNNIVSMGMGNGFDGRAGTEENEYHLPKMIEASWVSYVERKAYQISALLPYDSILSLFRGEGRLDNGIAANKLPQFNEFDLCFLHGGNVVLYVKAPGEVVLLDWNASGVENYDHASEVYMTRGCNSLKEFFDEYVYSGKFKEDHLWLTYTKKNGSPSGLINRYLQRFNYSLKFDFEDTNTSIYSVLSKYTNGEIHTSGNMVFSEEFSRLKEIKSMWDTKEFRYTSWMYFNEEEVLRIFDEAYGEDRMQQGELRIKVGADCKSYDLSLNVGGKSFKLEKTEIRVFQDPIDNPNGDGTLIYKNYEGNHRNFFIDDKEYFQE